MLQQGTMVPEVLHLLEDLEEARGSDFKLKKWCTSPTPKIAKLAEAAYQFVRCINWPEIEAIPIPWPVPIQDDVLEIQFKWRNRNLLLIFSEEDCSPSLVWWSWSGQEVGGQRKNVTREEFVQTLAWVTGLTPSVFMAGPDPRSLSKPTTYPLRPEQSLER